MERFTCLDAVALPVARPNVDTDQIVPARYLQKPRSDDFGTYLFRDLRYLADGTEHPDFLLNQPAYRAARIVVDTDSKTVNMTMDFTGMKIADLSDGLIARPVGPIHLHNYLPGGDVVLVLPSPFGPCYVDTPKGFAVTMKDMSYAAGAGILKSTLSFEDFLAAMASGSVVLNVHTDKFGDGEISGKVTAVPG